MLLNKDLVKLIDLVVPIGKEGILNVLSAKQLLESWRNKQIVDVELADNLIRSLEKRRAEWVDTQRNITMGSRGLMFTA